jgi:GNAT superfamily N-acetyltransferase
MLNTKKVEIRRAKVEDAAFIVSCQINMAMETEKVTLENYNITQGVKSVFENPTKGFYIVATIGDKECGCLMITPEWSDWRNAWVWWIQSVYVLPEYRSIGVFSLMYNFVRQQVIDRKDISGIRLYVDNTNKSAQEVYTRMGMNGGHYRTFEWMK